MRILNETAARWPRGKARMLPTGWLARWILGLVMSVGFAAPGLAWTAEFKKVPGGPEEGGQDTDMILGLIHANTLFFVALAVFGVFWFLFGGGRKANIGRKGH